MDLGVKRSRLNSYFDISLRIVEIDKNKSSMFIGVGIISEMRNKALNNAFSLSKMAHIEYSFYERNKISFQPINKEDFFLLEESILIILKYFKGKNDIEICGNEILFNPKVYSVKYFEKEIKNIIIENFIRPIIDGGKIFSFSYFTDIGDYSIEYNLYDGFKLKRFKMHKNILNNKYSIIKEMNLGNDSNSYFSFFRYKRKSIFMHFDKWYFEVLNRK